MEIRNKYLIEIRTILSFSALLLIYTSCFENLLPECSTVSGKRAYQGTIITDEPFDNHLLNVGDTLIIRPEYNVHGFNEYTGSEACEAESYELRPDFKILKFDEAVVSIELFEDSSGTPRYNDPSEVLLRVIGLEIGKDTVNLEASFSYYGSREDFIASKNYSIKIDIQ